MATTARKLEVWVVHGHLGKEAADYVELIRYVGRLKIEQRTETTETRVISLARISIAAAERVARITADEGPLGSEPRIFNFAADLQLR